MNRYSYVENNPIGRTDPSGHCFFALVDTIACVAAAAEVAELVVTAIAGAALITGAVAVGTQQGQAHAAAANDEAASESSTPSFER